MIRRDLDRADGETVDLAIVGGGVQGAALVLEAAQRGLSTVLVERDDFVGATTWNSLRIVHGGLRDLQRLDLSRCRHMAAEQRAWLTDFPDQVRPVRFVLPLGAASASRRAAVRLGLAMHDRLTRGCRDPRQIPAGSLAHHSTLDQPAAFWTEGVTAGPRLVIEMLRWACHLGARAWNRVEAIGHTGDRLALLDHRTGKTLTLRAHRVIVAAGPTSTALANRWLDGTAETAHANVAPTSLAFNLVLDRPAPIAEALALRVADGTRLLIPLTDRKTLAGTFHTPLDAHAEPPDAVPETAIMAAIQTLRRAAPWLDLEPGHVARVLSGLLPVRRASTTDLALRPHVHRHRPGLTSVVAVKLTTARLVARRVLDRYLGPFSRRQLAPRPRPAVVPRIESAITAEQARALSRLAADEAVGRLDDLLLRRTDWALRRDDLPQLRQRLADMLKLDG